MKEPFPIIDIPPDAPEADEDLGTKEKFWYRQNTVNYLYKKTRPIIQRRRLVREDSI